MVCFTVNPGLCPGLEYSAPLGLEHLHAGARRAGYTLLIPLSRGFQGRERSVYCVWRVVLR